MWREDAKAVCGLESQSVSPQGSRDALQKQKNAFLNRETVLVEVAVLSDQYQQKQGEEYQELEQINLPLLSHHPRPEGLFRFNLLDAK